MGGGGASHQVHFFLFLKPSRTSKIIPAKTSVVKVFKLGCACPLGLQAQFRGFSVG